MVRRLAVIIALTVFAMGAPSVFAASEPAAKCKDSKAKAAGKKAFALMKAFGKNISKNPDAKLGTNISKAESKFTKAFSKADAKGGCLTTGDAVTVEAIVDALIFNIVGSVTPTTTTTTSTSTTSTPSTSTPSTTTTLVPLGPLDHYRLYLASSVTSVISVTVADQWIPTSPVDLHFVDSFLVPVEKDTPIIDAFTHLTAYVEVLPPSFTPVNVEIDNQFGPQTITVTSPRFLLVPTEKFPAGTGALSPLPRDHFQCYDAVGPTAETSVMLTDQFSGPDEVTVDDVFLFCNPADKNGEGILSPLEHLTCYHTSPISSDPPPVGPVTIKNQFTAPSIGSVDVLAPQALCVPSAKLAVGPTTTSTSTTSTSTSSTTTTLPTSTTSTSTTSTTTTTTPTGFPPCSASTLWPACDGTCPPPLACVGSPGFCECATSLPCGDPSSLPPACWGECPPSMVCVDGSGTCVCVPG